MSNVDQIKALAYGIQFNDPRLYEILRLIADDIDKVDKELFPIVPAGSQTSTAAVYVTPVASIDYLLFSTYIQLSWDKPGDDAFSYEIRLDGASWEFADRITITQTLSVKLSPISVGTHTYRIKTLNNSGDYSSETTVSVIIPAIGAVTITGNVIDNNVLLYWTAPTSTFVIDHYDVYRNSVFFGNISGTFAMIFELLSAVYTYKIVPVDIAGSEGTEATIQLQVNQPPDFILQEEFFADLTTPPGTVTLSNVYVGNGRLLACVDTAQTWFEHFDDHGYASPGAQITDGFPLYLQPTEVAGSYIEKVDFGAIVTNLIATVDYNYLNIAGALGVTVSIEYSDDDVVWSGYTVGKQLFITSLRYLRVKIEFAGTDEDLLEITNLRYSLQVKQQVDSGTITADSGDVGGTEVTFNLAFKDVNSITVTPLSTEPMYGIYDFTDIPNPTSFFILVYDSSGNRVTQLTGWKARGIV